MSMLSCSPEAMATEAPQAFLLRVKGQTPSIVFPVGLVHSYCMHWCPDIARTQPCIRGACPYCEDGLPQRPISYVAVFHWRLYGATWGWFRSLLEVPLSTGLRLTDLPSRVLSLRRRRVFGPIDVETVTSKPPPPVPEGWDILPQLLRLWRLPRTCQFTLVSDNISMR